MIISLSLLVCTEFSNYLVVLGELVPSLDLTTGQAGISLSRQTATTTLHCDWSSNSNSNIVTAEKNI